jgi:hypothetical protein
MPLRIDRVDTEIEILKKDAGEGGGEDVGSGSGQGRGGGLDPLATKGGRIAFREMLRPYVMEILNDELTRIKRKVGSP